MNSKKALLTILGGVALTTVIGILLTPYKNSSRRKNVVEKARDFTETAGATIKASVSNGKTELKKMGEEADRMVNEGGNAIYNV